MPYCTLPHPTPAHFTLLYFIALNPMRFWIVTTLYQLGYKDDRAHPITLLSYAYVYTYAYVYVCACVFMYRCFYVCVQNEHAPVRPRNLSSSLYLSVGTRGRSERFEQVHGTHPTPPMETTGFEPTTSCMQNRRSTRLSYVPTVIRTPHPYRTHNPVEPKFLPSFTDAYLC